MTGFNEPWRRDDRSGLNCDIRDSTGIKAALCYGLSAGPKKAKGESWEEHRVRYERYRQRCDAYARRIVACVNACEGLSTEDLEKTGLVSAVGKQLIEADQQRDELLATLKRVRLFVIGESLPTRSQALDDIDAAIAKIEGGAA